MSTNIETRVKIPEGVEVSYTNKFLLVKGQKGELNKRLFYPGVKLNIEGGEVILSPKGNSRRYKKVVKTMASHIKNMFHGANEGWKAELRVVYSHFPMTAKVEGDTFKVLNFIGRANPKSMKIPKEVKVEVKGKEIQVEGIDIELVGQTAASIERLTRLLRVDRRKFLDGIFITKKPKDD